MKKLIIGTMLIMSALAFGKGDKFDYVEDKLQLKYVQLADNKKHTLDIDDIDVGMFNNQAYVNMEIEAFSGDGGWSKFDKKDYDKIATQIADDVRNMLNTKDKVEISLIVEKEIGKDMLLHNGMY